MVDLRSTLLMMRETWFIRNGKNRVTVLISPIEMIEVSHRGAPATFLVAIGRNGDRAAIVLGAGRGLTYQTALSSCRGEVIERMAAARSTGLIFQHAPEGLPGRSTTLGNIWLFSDKQLRDGPHTIEQVDNAAWTRAKAMITHCRQWMRAESLDGIRMLFVPAAAVLLDIDTPFSTSNGLAAGPDPAAARRAAVLELVERDAVSIWWFNRCRRPEVSLETLDRVEGQALRHWLEGRRRQTWVLDLTHDLGLPVAASISAERDGSSVAYGFAARSSMAEACLSAALEMLQAELSLDFALQHEAATGRAEGPAGQLLTWSRNASLKRLPHLLPDKAALAVPPAAPSADPIALVESITGDHVWFVDLSRAGDPLPVVRAIVPGLRHWKPRFAPGRLFDVPARLGWTFQPVEETLVGDDVILI